MCANAAGYSIDRIGSVRILYYPSRSLADRSTDPTDPHILAAGVFRLSSGDRGDRGITKGGRHVAIVWGALILIIIINIGCSSPKSRKSLALGACLYVKLFLIMQQQRQQQQQQQQLRQQHQQEQQQLQAGWPTVGQFVGRRDGLGQIKTRFKRNL